MMKRRFAMKRARVAEDPLVVQMENEDSGRSSRYEALETPIANDLIRVEDRTQRGQSVATHMVCSEVLDELEALLPIGWEWMAARCQHKPRFGWRFTPEEIAEMARPELLLYAERIDFLSDVGGGVWRTTPRRTLLLKQRRHRLLTIEGSNPDLIQRNPLVSKGRSFGDNADLDSPSPRRKAAREGRAFPGATEDQDPMLVIIACLHQDGRT